MMRAGEWRYPDAEEREALLKYPWQHTRTVHRTRGTHSHPQELEDTRLALLGNGFHVGVVAYLLHEQLHQIGILPHPPSPSLVDPNCIRRTEKFDVETAGEAKRFVQQIGKHQSHRGRLIQTTRGPAHPSIKGAALQTFFPQWWKWRTVIAKKWQRPEHINALELRAILTAVKWRTSRPTAIYTRALYLVDSQVALGALQKGRSPSPHLLPIIKRINALCLCASHTMLLGYVRTDLNPADRPSRAKL